MAFVYRNQKQLAQQQIISPGPGAYEPFQGSINNNSAIGFFDRVPRRLFNVSTTPGPGKYHQNMKKQQVNGLDLIFSNSQTQFYVTHAKGCSSNFKSKSKRLITNINKTPGPGHYDTATEHKKNATCSGWQKQTKLTKYLHKQNSKQHKPQQNLNLRQGSQQKYNQKSLHKSKQGSHKLEDKHSYKSSFNSKVERKIIPRPQTSHGVGPGTYKIQEFYKSTDKRSFNCPNKQSFTPKFAEQKDQLGPGCYEIELSTLKRPWTSNSRGIACFGSKQNRMTSQKMHFQKQKSPGPQTYFKGLQSNKSQDEKQVKKKVGFNSSVQKSKQLFNQAIPTINTSISPCSYYPKNDFNYLLKKNFLKGSIGKFGSKVQRFKSIQDKNKEMLNSNLQIQPFINNSEKENVREKISNKFKKIKRNIPKQFTKIEKVERDNRPLCYDSNINTIQGKLSKKTQIDAPFLVCSQRFTGTNNKNQVGIIDQFTKLQENNISIINTNKSTNKKGKICKGSESKSIIKRYNEFQKSIKNNQQNYVQNSECGFQAEKYMSHTFIKKSYNVLFRC